MRWRAYVVASRSHVIQANELVTQAYGARNAPAILRRLTAGQYERIKAGRGRMSPQMRQNVAVHLFAHHKTACLPRSGFLSRFSRLGTDLQRDGWAHLDLNQGPISYEPTALTAELWALAEGIISYLMGPGKG